MTKTCVCCEFDDGSAFELASFAGGAAIPGGAFSYVVCCHRQANGSAQFERYIRARDHEHMIRELRQEIQKLKGA